jgi:hypothetical protein
MDEGAQDATPVHKNIYAALAAAQMEMGNAAKDSSNPHFKSKYADLKSVRDAALPALNRHGIAVLQPLEVGELLNIQKTIFVHAESGESLETSIPCLLGKNDMQGLGAAITYARRYGLMSLAGIAPAEDDDGNSNAARNPMGAALGDAWRQSVEDSLPENATPQQKAAAYATAIRADFEGKGEKALKNRWEKHKSLIGSLEGRFPELHGEVIDAYEIAMMAATGNNVGNGY